MQVLVSIVDSRDKTGLVRFGDKMDSHGIGEKKVLPWTPAPPLTLSI